MTGASGVLEASFEASPGNAAILDADGVIVAVNDGWRAFGRSEGLQAEDAAVGTNYVDVCRGSEDEWAADAVDGFERLLAGEDDQFSLEYPCHSPEEKRWFLLRAVRFERAGEPYVLATHFDITDRKEAELEVRRRNEDLSDLVALLAHDVRNPLSVARGWLETVEPRDEDDRNALDRVSRSLDRIGEVVDDALTFMRSEVTAEDREWVDLGDLAREHWEELVGTDATATLSVSGEPRVYCYPDLFDHLVSNLLTNAVDHGGEDVTVEVGATDDGFYVADDGPGIPAAELEHIFETGFSTDYDGTGFGLAIVESVADRHGWEISVGESESGGARFVVRTKPAYEADPEPAEQGADVRPRD